MNPILWGLFLTTTLLAANPATHPTEGGNVTIIIHDQQVTHTVSEQFAGTNLVALWNPTADSPGAVHAFAQMGMKLLRFPGGVPAQFYDWEKPLDSGWSLLTPERAGTMAQAAGAQLIFQTNIANDKIEGDKKTGKTFRFNSSGEHQAGWVRFAREKGIPVAFWEIGNEPEMDAPQPIKAKKSQEAIYDWYNAKYAEQVKAIKAVDPDARVMGPAATNTWFWWHEKNLEKFLAAHGNRQGTGLADVISLHWYIEGEATWEKRRGAAQGWQQAMDYVTGVIAQYDTRQLPVYITEWNWAGGDRDDQAMRIAGALGNADVIGMFLRTGIAGHNHFCLQRIGKNWGCLAIKGDVKPENAPSPTYFALAMTSHMGPQVLNVTNPADDKNVLSVYATKKADGSVQVLLINKSDQPQNVTLAFDGSGAAAPTLHAYRLRGINNQISDTEVIYNGVASPAPASTQLPPPQTVKVTGQYIEPMHPYSMTVLVFGGNP